MTTMQQLSRLTAVAQALSMTPACALCLTNRASCSHGAHMGAITASRSSCGQGGCAPDARQERRGPVYGLPCTHGGRMGPGHGPRAAPGLRAVMRPARSCA